MENTIRVSVIVTVSQGGKKLERCLGYLVNQSLKEIEILVVGNEDAFARSFEQSYPEKVRVLSSDKKGADLLNCGIENTSGEYITFCRDDEYIEYWAFKKAYETAQKGNFSVVSAPYHRVEGTTKTTMGWLAAEYNFNHLTNPAIYRLSTKLFRRDFFEEHGALPSFEYGCCEAYLVPLLTKGLKMGTVWTPYCYVDSNIAPSAENAAETVTDVNNHIIGNSAQEHLSVVVPMIVRRTLALMNEHRSLFDTCVDYLQKNRELIETHSDILKYVPDEKKQLEEIYRTCAEARIPRHIFVADFGAENASDFSVFNRTLNNSCKVTVLNESNCNVKENALVEKAYSMKLFDFVGEYFAAKTVFENGGIYLDKTVELRGTFEQFLCNHAFFAKCGSRLLTAKVFGAVANNELMRFVLDTYSMPELYPETFAPLSTRIKTALIICRGFSLDNVQRQYLADYTAVYEPDVFVLPSKDSAAVSVKPESNAENTEVSTAFITCFEEHANSLKLQLNEKTKAHSAVAQKLERIEKELAAEKARAEKYRVSAAETKASLDSLKQSHTALQGEMNKLSTLHTALSAEHKTLAANHEKALSEISAIKTSTSWKITKPVRVIMNLIKKLLRR